MLQYWEQGGWPMIPLLVCSLAALAIIIERVFALRRSRVLSPYIVDMIETYQGEGSAQSAAEISRRRGGPLGRIVESMLRARRLDRSHLIETMYAAGRSELVGLERGLIVLEIVAGISPLIGLLGTVLGMVTVFDAISQEGIGDPQVLSEGISQALITTVAGLLVAIPALAFHSLLTKRAEILAIELHEWSTAFLTRIDPTTSPRSLPDPIAPAVTAPPRV